MPRITHKDCEQNTMQLANVTIGWSQTTDKDITPAQKADQIFPLGFVRTWVVRTPFLVDGDKHVTYDNTNTALEYLAKVGAIRVVPREEIIKRYGIYNGTWLQIADIGALLPKPRNPAAELAAYFQEPWDAHQTHAGAGPTLAAAAAADRATAMTRALASSAGEGEDGTIQVVAPVTATSTPAAA